MMLDDFLSRLNKVKRNGQRYLACCPAHDDKSPSLSVSQGDDDRILVHCFAGCSAADVVGSMGLELKDLFADPGMSISEKAAYKRERERMDILIALANEKLIIQMALAQMGKGGELSPEDAERVSLADRRIEKMRLMLGRAAA